MISVIGGVFVKEAMIQDIIRQVMDALQKQEEAVFQVEASARHVHLSREHIDQLFGQGYDMTKKKALSQPGQFQCQERVTLIGPKGVIKGVAILGPPRSKTQVELSKTDARVLGVTPPVRESGQLEGSASIYIATELGVIEALESTIVAKRHIHMDTRDAKRFQVSDKQMVAVRVQGERPAIFEDVVVRVSDDYCLSMHIDFDEANAVGYHQGAVGEICKLT